MELKYDLQTNYGEESSKHVNLKQLALLKERSSGIPICICAL